MSVYHMTDFKRDGKTSIVKLNEKHKPSGLTVLKRAAIMGGERVYIGMRTVGLSEEGVQDITSIALSKNELGSFINFLKRITIKLETIKSEI